MQDVLDQIRGLTLDPQLIAVIGGSVVLLLVLVLALRRGGSPSLDQDAAVEEALAACGGASVLFGYRGGRVVLEQVSGSIKILTDFEPDALIGKDAFFRMLHEDDANQLRRRLASAIQDERPISCDAKYTDAGGRSRWMQVRVGPARDSRGRLNKLRGIVREVSEPRQLAQEVASTWASFHALADATPAMLWVLDADGRVTAVNRATERFCAVNEAALVGDGWLAAVAEDEIAGVGDFIGRVIELGTSMTRDVTMIDADNRERVIAMTATAALDDEGVIGSVVLTGRDVTDRSASDKLRERLARLIDTSESPAVIVAPDMRVSMLNQTARQRAGLGDREPADSIALWHVVTQETVERIRRDAVHVCADGGVFALRGHMRDGGEGSLASELTVVGLGDGWLGITAREIEHELVRERDAALDRRRLEIMLGVLGRLSGGGWSPGRTAQRIVESIAVAYPGMRASFGTVVNGQTLLCEASEEPVWMGSAAGRSLTLDRGGELLTTLAKGEPVLIEDAWAEPDLDPSRLTLEEHSVRSLAMLRADTGDPQMTVMTLERSDVGQWTRDHIEALRLASRLLGLAARADQERRARMAAEARAAEQTQRWRESREHMDTLAAQAADKASENERLAYQLDRVSEQWTQPILAFGQRVTSLREMAEEARSAGLHALAHGVDGIMHEADRLELSAAVLTRSPMDPPERVSAADLVAGVERLVRPEFDRRGVKLTIETEAEDAVTCEVSARAWRVAASELLSACLRRCRGQDVAASVTILGADKSDRTPAQLRVSIESGTLSPETGSSEGVLTGVALVGRLAERLGGAFGSEPDPQRTRLTLSVPVEIVPAEDTGGDDSPEMDEAA